MANRSTFVAPNYTPDQFATLYELSASQLNDARRYQELMLKRTNLTSGEAVELENLTNGLKDYLITAERWNHFQDALMSMQWFIKNNVEGYILTKQAEFQAEINKFSVMGEYSPTTRYFKNNVVTLNGESFIALQETVNNPPPTGANSNNWWAKASSRGATGPKGDPGLNGTNQIFRGAYNAASTYSANDLVQYEGNTYSCLQTSTGRTPVDDKVYWALFLAKGQSVTLQQFLSSTTLVTNASNVAINIPEFNYATDILLVFINSTFTQKEVDWVLNDNKISIDKKTGSWVAGTVIDIICFKNMQTSLIYTDGTMIQDGTIGKAKLGSWFAAYDFKNGSDTLNGTTGKTITHNFGSTAYKVQITPTANPGGYVWVESKTATTMIVKCSAASSAAFDWEIKKA